VAVYGGGETGSETAEYLADHGAKVTLITRSASSQLARSAERNYRLALVQRLKSNPRITVREHMHLNRIDAGALQLRALDSAEESLRVTHTFIAQGQTPDPTLSQQLHALRVPHAVIGDAVRVRRIGDAVDDAYRAVWMLNERLQPVRIAC